MGGDGRPPVLAASRRERHLHLPRRHLHHARHGGGDGALGYPTGWPVGEGEARTYQQFEHGVVYTSPSGTFAVTGGAAALHRDHGGGGGSLGYPTARGISESVTHGYQTFEHGIVYTSPRGSVTIPSPAVRGVHESRLGGRGPLGYPVAAPVQQAPRYSYQEFERGVVYTSPRGTFAVDGPAHRHHVFWGGGGGRALGYPVGEVTGIGGGYWRQAFERAGVEAGARSAWTVRAVATPTDGAKDIPGFTNGMLPASQLCALPFRPTHRVHCKALEDTVNLNTAYRDRFGENLPVDHWPYSTYRTQDDQRIVLATIFTAPVVSAPGRSPHGWGLAIDFLENEPGGPNTYGFGSARHEWLRNNSHKFGWVQLEHHSATGRWKEYWHFDYTR